MSPVLGRFAPVKSTQVFLAGLYFSSMALAIFSQCVVGDVRVRRPEPGTSISKARGAAATGIRRITRPGNSPQPVPLAFSGGTPFESLPGFGSKPSQICFALRRTLVNAPEVLAAASSGEAER